LNFLKIVAVKSVLFVKEYVRFCPYFLHILSQNSVQETSTTTSLGFYEFHDTGRIEILLYLGAYINLCLYFPLFCPIWVKIGIGCLNVMLLISYEFLQNQRRKDCSFLIGINEKHLSV